MHSRIRAQGVMLAGLLALVAALATPATLTARPQPGAQRTGFRLFARAIGALTINRVYCGLSSTGEICVDSTGSSTIGGGYWPKGGPNQYVFNSGMQMGGIIDPASGFKWAGDTTGAFFFDPKGTTQHGQQIQPIWNYSSASDAAAWPAAANVPQGDAQASYFFPLLRGLPTASQGDMWTLAWDGDPSLTAGRPHPLGVMVETRGLGWNYPSGNEDILYYIYTFYNVTSADAGDYSSLRPAMQTVAAAQGQVFQAKNNAAYGITIPTHGYTIKNFYANFAADMDVSSNAGANFGSVNLPFQLGYAYQANFNKSEGSYVLPPDAGGAPFVGGYGFVGVKYLASPIDPNTNQPVGLTLFSNTINGNAAFNDPQNTTQLYRYMSGNVTPALGDGNCNYNPTVDHICYIRQSGPVDIRFFQSSGPFDLPAGQSGSIVVAYIFASAVKTGTCPAPGCADVVPGNPLVNNSAATLLSSGANPVDSMTGFAGYAGVTGQPVDQFKYKVVKGSLLSKALIAQTVFNNQFLLPFAPSAPDFFLVPGDNQVAIFWKKSASEATGDLFYSIAHSALSGGVPNQLYDANYRQFDVEGYRIYRGRTDDPSSLKLLAQFDYDNTTFEDYQGQVNPEATCAPEIGIPDSTCGGTYDQLVPGVALTKHVDYPIVSPLIQVKLGDRTALANGTAIALKADTAVTGGNSGLPELKDTGVPFVYLDKSAKNNLRYFYAVTAFDINSVNSGPSSLESPRSTKSATPVHFASNYTTAGDLQVHTGGRGVGTDTIFKTAPTLDGTTGIFSGPARPATGASLGFVGALVSQVVKQSGSMSVTVDSMVLGSAYDGIPNQYYLSIASATGTVHATLPVTQDQFDGTVSTSGTIDGGPIDNSLAHLYGGNNTYHLGAAYTLTYPGNYFTSSYGRGCVNGAIPAPCNYNGARWFDGPSPASNETFPHPTRGNGVNGFGGTVPTPTNPDNAGMVTGVNWINESRSYLSTDNTWRNIEGALGGAATAADYNVYWGTTPGTVDSVVDVTDNVLVPFAPDGKKGYTWGFLNTSATNGASYDAQAGVLTTTDFSCVEPWKSFGSVQSVIACGSATPYLLSNTAQAGAVGFWSGAYGNAKTASAAATPGFGIYMPGHWFIVDLSSNTLPSKPAVWTLRTYTGGIKGGGGSVGSAGDNGAYKFYPAASPLVAPGSQVAANYSVTNKVAASTKGSLDAVHTVPDPYYVTNQYETSPTGKVIKFVNLPQRCIIRIYTTSGVLVRMLEHNPSTYSGEEDWDVRNRNNQVVASGVYFYSIESSSGPRVVKRLTIVNFAQ
jgi:hypothetical protein